MLSCREATMPTIRNLQSPIQAQPYFASIGSVWLGGHRTGPQMKWEVNGQLKCRMKHMRITSSRRYCQQYLMCNQSRSHSIYFDAEDAALVCCCNVSTSASETKVGKQQEKRRATATGDAIKGLAEKQNDRKMAWLIPHDKVSLFEDLHHEWQHHSYVFCAT